MGDSSKFLSIDEQAVSKRSVNVEEATSNLQKLQEHIFYPKSSRANIESTVNYPKSSVSCPKSAADFPKPSTKYPEISTNYCSSSETNQSLSDNNKSDNNPKTSVAMAAGTKITLSEGKGILFERQQSVTDDDLFGEGRKHQTHPDQNTDRVDGVNLTDLGDKDKSDVNDAGDIPNFGMLGLSSSSDSGSSSSPKPLQDIQHAANVEEKTNEVKSKTEIGADRKSIIKYSDGQDSDFKIRYLEKRSISADDRREKYRNSSGGDVFEHIIESTEEEYQVCMGVRKSNSLPDLVTSTNQSPLSPQQYHSNPHCDLTEDVEILKQYELKKRMEGTSTRPASNANPKIKRTVSIKEEPEIIPADSDDEVGNENNDTPESEKKPVTPTEERRRILSSGYVTESSEAGSQDKSEVGTNRQISQNSQGSSGVWTSVESVEKTETVGETNASSKRRDSAEVAELTGLPPVDTSSLSIHSAESLNISPLSSGSGFNDSGSTGSSVNTILDAKTHEFVRKRSGEKHTAAKPQVQVELNVKRSQDLSSGELPNLSIMVADVGSRSQDKSSSFGGLRIDEENKEKKGIKSNAKISAELKQEHAIELKTPDSFEPQSGNLPNFSTLESFSLKGSSLAKVQAEEDVNHMAVKEKYCREGDDGSLGVGQAGPGSVLIPSRGSSLSNQPSPPDVVKRFEEQLLLLKNDALSPSDIEKIRQAIRGPDSLTSPYSHGERPDTPGSQTFKDVTLDDLERASRCNFPACKETCCLKMREVFRVLKKDIPHIDIMFKLVKSYSRALYQHSDHGCEETKCPVLFCSEILEWDTWSSEDLVKCMVEEIQKYFRNPQMKLFLQTGSKFHELQSMMAKLQVKEFETHTPMFAMGKFGTAHVCMDNQLQKLVVLKMYPLMEYDHQLSLYTRLKNLNHPSIVQQQWLLVYDDKIQVCSLFAQGGSLEDYLNCVGRLPWSRVVRYMKQILSAIHHLHERGVVYFNWNSGNMLFPDDRRGTIQVGNFSLSCPVGCQWDLGSVKECLPYNICPPELFDLNYKVDFKSDVWGAGCLFYEMLAGFPVLHDLRHEDRRTVHSEILAGTLPDIKSLSTEKRTVLDYCWQTKMEDRRRLEDILQYIESLTMR